MLRFFVFICFFSLFSTIISAKPVIFIPNDQTNAFFALPQDEFDVAGANSEGLTAIVTENGIRQLKRNGIYFNTLKQDIEEIYTPLRNRVNRGTSSYHKYDALVAELKSIAAQHSEIASLESIGKSCQNRDIYAIKITGSSTAASKPAMLVCGLTHAREWISMEVPLALINKLVNSYGSDQELTKLVNERTVWVVPVINPDGLVYTQTTGDWRKNRRDNKDGTFGVDLNRNADAKWGTAGDSGSTYSDTYRGKSAFSEPELTALRDLARREKMQSMISFHSYGELVLYPWGYTSSIHTADDAKLSKISKDMAKENSYTPEQSADLYPASGDFCDWAYMENKCFAYTIELGQDFVPTDSEVPSICDQNVKTSLVLLKATGQTSLNTESSISGNDCGYETELNQTLKNLFPDQDLQALSKINPEPAENFEKISKMTDTSGY
ncbi:MAG: M14 family metallopeptidase [Candidatus Wallbacteria bacterium]|nr:M14 family metallopeptidase [Candidatus Wallbacteria bacterium]